VSYRDSNQGLEYLRRGSDLRDNGLTLNLHGYQYVVLQEWRELRASAEKPWNQLCDSLNGAGVHSLEEAIATLRLRPVHDALQQLISPANLNAFIEAAHFAMPLAAEEEPITTKEFPKTLNQVAKQVKAAPENNVAAVPEALATVEVTTPAAHQDAFAKFVSSGEDFYNKAAMFFPILDGAQSPTQNASQKSSPPFSYAHRLRETAALVTRSPFIKKELAASSAISSFEPKAFRTQLPSSQWGLVMIWIALKSLPEAVNRTAFFDELRLRSALAEMFSTVGIYGEDSWRAAARIRVLLAQQATLPETIGSNQFWEDPDVQWLLGKSEAHGSTYFEKEKFEELLTWLQVIDLTVLSEKEALDRNEQLEYIFDLAKQAEYQIDKFRNLQRVGKRMPQQAQLSKKG
jgi:hypothetical protein